MRKHPAKAGHVPPPLTPSQSQMLGELLSAGSGRGGTGTGRGALESRPRLVLPLPPPGPPSSAQVGRHHDVGLPTGHSFIGLCLQVPPDLGLCLRTQVMTLESYMSASRGFGTLNREARALRGALGLGVVPGENPSVRPGASWEGFLGMSRGPRRCGRLPPPEEPHDALVMGRRLGLHGRAPNTSRPRPSARLCPLAQASGPALGPQSWEPGSRKM